MERQKVIGLAVAGVVILSLTIGLGVGLQKDDLDSAPLSPEFLTRKTQNGLVRGLMYDPDDPPSFNQIGDFDNNVVHNTAMFLGIPYAAPPVGDNRFKSPKDPESWENVKDVFTKPASCAQKCHEPCPNIQEDCLYLNVFVPIDALEKPSEIAPLPVLVWFHGGAFTWGSGSSFLYDGRYMAPEMNAIIVTVNYRLSAFGFLQLPFVEQGETTNANWGFLDQQKSLEWVYNNIANFNGDPNRITVAGQSAGGISTSLHHINEHSSSMIRNVIVQSNPLAIGLKENWEGMLQTSHFAHAAGCNNADPTCLRELSVDDIVAAVGKTPPFVNNDHILHAATPFAPIIDKVHIHEQPLYTLRNGSYNTDIAILAGTVQHESEMFVRSIAHAPIGDQLYKFLWRALFKDTNIVDQIMHEYPPCKDADGVTEHKNEFIGENCEDVVCNLLGDKCSILQGQIPGVCEQLIEGITKNCDDRETIEAPGTEWIFTCPTLEWLQYAAGEETEKKVWAYQFRAAMPLDVSKIEGDQWEYYERCKVLSCHAAELSYEFSVEKTLNCTALEEDPNREDLVTCEQNGNLLSDDEIEMERQMHIYWRNFLHNSNPNDFTGFEVEELIHWENYGASNGAMKIGFNELNDPADRKIMSFENKFKETECNFWNSLDVYTHH